MPVRSIPLVSGEYYHIINRGIGLAPIFKGKRDCQKFINAFCFYQNSRPPLKFSKFSSLPVIEREAVFNKMLQKKNLLVEVVAYCLMPNHFHFLIKQIKEEGIKNFIRLLDNSYSHYFNIKYSRKGPLFEGRFKAVLIESNEQLLHLSRYIHLNPYSSYLIKSLEKLAEYSYSSLPEYLSANTEQLCNKGVIIDQFSNSNAYKKFLFDQADYQRALQQIKHQLLE